jgi:DNA-binding MarR family transcriptional regulator
MEKKKLVKKSKDPRYKNRLIITLTSKGEESYNRTLGRHTIRRVMSVLNERERKQFMRCLDKISEQAEKELGLIHEETPSSK